MKAAEDADAANGSATIEHAVSGGGYAGVTASSVTVTESDNDAALSVTLDRDSYEVSEADGAVEVCVVVSSAWFGEPGSVRLETSDGTASGGRDYAVLEAILQFAASDLRQCVSVPIFDDEEEEAQPETFTVALSEASGAALGVWVSATVTIVDDDAPAVLPSRPRDLRAVGGDELAALTWSAPENDGGSEITGYAYRFVEVGGIFGDYADILESGFGEANAAGYTVAGLTNGRTYVFQVRARNARGSGLPAEVSVTLPPEATSVESEELPTAAALMGNYPNPFNSETTIRYALPQAGKARLAVYDLLGHEVATLVDGLRPAGRHSARFDAGGLASGAYVYRLEAADRIVVRTMVLVK